MPDRLDTAIVLGIFESPQLLLQAIPEVKAKVSGALEAYTPYPVHGLDKALGLRKSPIGGMVFVMGCIGALSAMGLELWTSGRDYPQVTAGKPVFSWEAFVPVMFEMTVLFAAFTAGFGMLFLLNRLPMLRHPVLQSSAMPLFTRDKFGLSVAPTSGAGDAETIAAILKACGASGVEVVAPPPSPGMVSPKFLLGVLAAIALACGIAGYSTYWGIKLFPVLVPMTHMLDQPRLNPQSANEFFKDGSGMRMPVAGTVMRGSYPQPSAHQAAAAALGNPLPRTRNVLNQGRQAYASFCATCHGLLGDGATSLTAAYGAKPANLVAPGMIQLPDGSMYQTIMAGKNAMPAYAADLTEDERWAVVHYMRVLQRALNARDEDFKK